MTAAQTQKIFFAMGTVNSITVFEKADEALTAAKNRVTELHRRLSAYADDSQISAINRNAGTAPVQVSADTFSLIERAVQYSEITGGCFDMTARPLAQLWKTAMKNGIFPNEIAIKKAKVLTNYKDILLDREQQTVLLRNKGQQLDPGGIAKGYAADEVRRILREYGVQNAVINLGGTVINLGDTRKIGLQTPFAENGQHFASLQIADGMAVVSSGIYEQFRMMNGKRIQHIADPRTGFPSDSGLIGVTLIGRNAEELDALATAVLILGAADSPEILRQREIGAVFITDERQVFVTENLRGKLTIREERSA